MNKCNNYGYCQNHCQCDWECEKCSEPSREEIIEEWEPEEPEFIQECGTDEIDDIEIEEPEPTDKEIEDNPDIIYCYEE